ARMFLQHAITAAGTAPTEVVTDRAPVYPRLLDELVPAAWHHSEQHGNNRIEADHGHLKRRLRPMRHLRKDRSATAIIAGHAFVQNLRQPAPRPLPPHRRRADEATPHRRIRRTP